MPVMLPMAPIMSLHFDYLRDNMVQARKPKLSTFTNNFFFFFFVDLILIDLASGSTHHFQGQLKSRSDLIP